MIQQMIAELQEYKRDKSVIMKTAIQERLDASYNAYVTELEESMLFLSKRHELSILKRINK